MGQIDVERARPSPESSSSARLGQYLRRLREGYGYTLRKVEEKSAEVGEPIDNSQLSRFEKGKALPSFDKLRALARVFNVSVQSFSDVLDLDEYESLKPTTAGYDRALEIGAEAFSLGEHGRAFAAFERALEAAEELDDDEARSERVAEARYRLAAALKALGKLSMTERELREILKEGARLPRRVRVRALLQLAFVHRELSDLYLAEVLAKESLQLARDDGDLASQAAVHNTLGNIYEDDDPARAVPFYEEAERLWAEVGHEERTLTVRTNLGGCLVKTRRFEEGIARLDDVHRTARTRGYRRVAALSLTRLAEAWLQRGHHDRAARALGDSDALAAGPEAYHDILFLNTFHRWTVARQEGNATREKLAFGRLRHLRSLIERRFAEVDAFDRHVETTRRIPS